MKRPAAYFLVLVLIFAGAILLFSALPLLAQSGASVSPANSSAVAQETTAQPASQATNSYTLSPGRAAQAIAYARVRHILYFLEFGYGLLVLLAVLKFRLAPAYRDWAERATRNRFLQAVVFVPLLLFTLDLTSLPFAVIYHALARHYAQSIQGWSSWLWDWTKGELLSMAVAAFLVWLLYAVMRRSRRWWLYVWVAFLPILVFGVFIYPLFVEPLFFRFTPLADAQPQLAAELERVVTRAGQQIPPGRMYLMNASSKLNELNAYVTGIGASRRVVVWDTTIAKMTAPEIAFVFGHEMGHYVLGHVRNGVIVSAVVILAFLFLGSRLWAWAVARWGGAWGLRGIDDWASLPVLLLLVSLFSFLFTPVGSAYSRHLEHQADQYGLEVIHGIVPDAPQVAAAAFQILGDVDLEEPAPSPLVKFWFYDHPPIAERILFAYSYDPWARGEAPAFVK